MAMKCGGSLYCTTLTWKVKRTREDIGRAAIYHTQKQKHIHTYTHTHTHTHLYTHTHAYTHLYTHKNTQHTKLFHTNGIHWDTQFILYLLSHTYTRVHIFWYADKYMYNWTCMHVCTNTFYQINKQWADTLNAITASRYMVHNLLVFTTAKSALLCSLSLSPSLYSPTSTLLFLLFLLLSFNKENKGQRVKKWELPCTCTGRPPSLSSISTAIRAAVPCSSAVDLEPCIRQGKLLPQPSLNIEPCIGQGKLLPQPSLNMEPCIGKGKLLPQPSLNIKPCIGQGKLLPQPSLNMSIWFSCIYS